MTRKFQSTHRFDKQFKSLDKKSIKQAEKAIELFINDPIHPSPRFKKVQGTDNFYEINMSIRIIIEIKSQDKDQVNTFYIIGKHEEVFPVN